FAVLAIVMAVRNLDRLWHHPSSGLRQAPLRTRETDGVNWSRPPQQTTRSEAATSTSGQPLAGGTILARGAGNLHPRDANMIARGTLRSGHPQGNPAALLFDNTSPSYDSGEESRFSTQTRFQLPDSSDISGPTGSISFQFEPEWSGDNHADASLI